MRPSPNSAACSIIPLTSSSFVTSHRIPSAWPGWAAFSRAVSRTRFASLTSARTTRFAP